MRFNLKTDGESTIFTEQATFLLHDATYSLVAGRQPLAVRVLSRCSFVLTVVLNLWQHGVPAEAADPVASAADTQAEINTRQKAAGAPALAWAHTYEGKLSRGGTWQDRWKTFGQRSQQSRSPPIRHTAQKSSLSISVSSDWNSSGPL